MVKDVSISPASIQQHDVSIDARQPVLMDVSVEQTTPEHNEASIQYSRNNREVSVQLDQPSKHEVSIQEVPMFVDETVHMTKDEEEIAIQCNAENQSISIQYSAKPLIEKMEENLPDESSLSYTQQD
jgi:hypothetical protein